MWFFLYLVLILQRNVAFGYLLLPLQYLGWWGSEGSFRIWLTFLCEISVDLVYWCLIQPKDLGRRHYELKFARVCSQKYKSAPKTVQTEKYMYEKRVLYVVINPETAQFLQDKKQTVWASSFILWISIPFRSRCPNIYKIPPFEPKHLCLIWVKINNHLFCFSNMKKKEHYNPPIQEAARINFHIIVLRPFAFLKRTFRPHLCVAEQLTAAFTLTALHFAFCRCYSPVCSSWALKTVQTLVQNKKAAFLNKAILSQKDITGIKATKG